MFDKIHTLAAIKSYKTRIAAGADGVLSSYEQTKLKSDASSERQKTGFSPTYDENGKFWIKLPTSFLRKSKVESDGTVWVSKDNRLTVVVSRGRYDGGSFAATYRNGATSDIFGEIKYQTFRERYFIISGVKERAKIYARGQDDNGTVLIFFAVWPVGGGDSDIRKLVVAISNSMQDDDEKSSPGLPVPKPENETVAQSDDDRIDQGPLAVPTVPAKKEIQTGTGFFVSSTGYLITNAHVVGGCTDATLLLSDGRESNAAIVGRNQRDDLAILKSQVNAATFANFRSTPPLRLGTDIVVFGYPRLDLLTSTGNLVNGLVSGLAGPNNDASLIQISAPVQSGNSGGAVLDRSGNVVGVVVAKTNLTSSADKIEVLQQANFAINADLVVAFLNENKIPIGMVASVAEKPTADVADVAKGFTAIVLCEPK
jgi:S1-C subfamily serine protease